MALKEGTNFEQEADNAARMIDHLCKKYGVTVDDALTPSVGDENYQSFKRLDNSIAILFSAVAAFYDAKAYISGGKDLKLIGTEAQQIQTRLYYEYLHDCMEVECKKAHTAEKILAELTGQSVDRSFKKNFKIAFARSVQQRLIEKKKEENRIHEHSEYTKGYLSTMRFTRRTAVGARGDGAFSGDSAGNSVSLHRQTNGSAQRQLTGAC